MDFTNFSFHAVTPMQSIANQLLYERAEGTRELQHIKFIWMDRDAIFVHHQQHPVQSESDYTASTCDNADFRFENKKVPFVDIASVLLTIFPEQTTDEGVELMYNEDLDEIGINKFEFGAITSPNCFSMVDETVSTTHILDKQIYITRKSNLASSMPDIREGRPNMKLIFKEMKDFVLANGDDRIAVCVCGPMQLSKLCQKLCITQSDEKVRFDFHSESQSF